MVVCLVCLCDGRVTNPGYSPPLAPMTTGVASNQAPCDLNGIIENGSMSKLLNIPKILIM